MRWWVHNGSRPWAWQAATGRMRRKDKIGRRQPSSLPLDCATRRSPSEAHGDSFEGPGGLRLPGVPGRRHRIWLDCRTAYGTTARGSL
ncbi:hypothetical protein T12_38 [Trichinella patagoniensis]|uniref:Uncharacterized protein n=1 Tax=Trichinella patagoniensis TaxID=990121 RepID=A0A0V0ZMB6_9BILA|nr:hypothetical protein T12_38 [Trichinella patagoniensis]